MLREDRRAQFEVEQRFLIRRYRFATGSLVGEKHLSPRAHADLMARQLDEPIAVLHDERKTWWLFGGRTYWEDDGLCADDVKALALEREGRRAKQLERARDRMSQQPTTRREGIPEELRRLVFRRDGGACVECKSQELLQFDHIIPISRGGATTARNLQILCTVCNREKSDAI
jgi:hypothetical protein